jgi:hypothetical protein
LHQSGASVSFPRCTRSYLSPSSVLNAWLSSSGASEKRSGSTPPRTSPRPRAAMKPSPSAVPRTPRYFPLPWPWP